MTRKRVLLLGPVLLALAGSYPLNVAHASSAACPRGLMLNDGCPTTAVALGSNTVQHADFFSGYATQKSKPQMKAGIDRKNYPNGWRPAWNLPGIDYPVGIPADIALLDPVVNSSKLPAGCQLASAQGYNRSGTTYSILCNGYVAGSANNGKTGTQGLAVNTYTKLKLDGWDFRKNSVSLVVQNWRGEIQFTHNRVGGSVINGAKAQNAWIVLSLSQNTAQDACMKTPALGCVQIRENYLDGNVAGYDPNSKVWWGTDLIQIDQGFKASYNVMMNANARFIIQGTRHRPSLQDYCYITNNYIEGFLNPDKPQLDAHGEIALLGGPCGHSFYSYNTILQPTKNGLNTTVPSASKNGNDGDVSGFVFPFTGTSPANCTNVTFSGATGTVKGACDKEGASTRTGLNNDTKLVVTDKSGKQIKGYVTAFNGMDQNNYDGSPIKTITMSESNAISQGVSLSVTQVVPEFHVDHNVMVSNYWDTGSTTFGVMIGGLSTHSYRLLRIEQNWFDTTGSFGCFQPTNGVSVIEASKRTTKLMASGNVDLTAMGSYFGALSDTQNKNCRGLKDGLNGRFGEP